RDEPVLDVGRRHPHLRPEAASPEARHRRSACTGRHRARTRDRHHALADSGTYFTSDVTTRKREKVMSSHKIGTPEEWLTARLELLDAEKELTRRGDELARRRQELPWVRVDKNYRFETDEGTASLADLFRGRSQLLVYHFMFGPDYTAVSQSIVGTDWQTYRQEGPGVSAFALEDGIVYHTYSAYARGLDGLWGMYQWLDRAPLGRNETGFWWRRHDEYGNE